jgi:puromycin-sensitive aminopeptidase
MRTLRLTLLFAALFPASAFADRLPGTVVPDHYDLSFAIDLARERFSGQETIRVRVGQATSRIVLHALDLELQQVTIEAAGSTQNATVSFDRNAETATLTVPQRIAPGPADIRLRFAGALNTRLSGLYLSKTSKRKYAVTQFESTDARRAFPCFDEPAFKATFALELTIDRGDTAISNGTILSDVPGPGRTQHTLKFTTSPKMSSYLVAMAVGDFQCAEGAEANVPIRVCATPDKMNLVQSALESTKAILKFYDGYYAIKYPFTKLDLVAVPDFAAGAMENTAAIFFRETALLADAGASVSTRKNIADTIAHEMAHQWFGDLVTMAWWDDLWLNEGFATWMATHPLAAWKPEWHLDVDEASANQRAINLDSLASTHPIHASVETVAEIEGAFDAITYGKGAAVLRMVESYVGADTFRRAINRYLQAHAYGNATSEDFWSAVAAESGRPVDRIIPAFIEQPGVPLVEITSLTCDSQMTETRATFRQSRFTLKADSERDDRLWQIPIAYAVNAARPPASPPGSFLLSDRTHTEVVARGCVPWVFANAGAQGYYRTAYPREMLRALAPSVLTALTAPERLSLIEDEWALVRAGRRGVADYLTIAAGFGREQASGVLTRVTSHFGFVHQYLTSDPARPKFQEFVRAQLRPSFDSLGIEAAGNESDDRRALRAIVVAALGTTGEDPDVVARSRAAVDRALAGGAALDPASAASLVTVAAAHGDARLYDALAAAAKRIASPEEHYRYLNALTAFRDPALIERALQETRSTVRNQDTALYLARFFENPAARDRAWAFIKESWSDLEPKLRIAFGEGRVVGAVAAFCDARTRDDIRAFFTTHPLTSATRTLAESLERIDNCIALREKQTTLVTEWLGTR